MRISPFRSFILSVAAAVASLPVVAQVTEKPTSMGSAAVAGQVVTALAVVIATIAALAWCVKRLNGGAFMHNREISVLATMPVGTREKIVLVDVRGVHLLLGVTASQVNCLHVFDGAANPTPTEEDDPLPATLSTPVSPSVTSSWDFASAIKKIMRESSRK